MVWLYTTMFTSGGGGGNSLIVVVSAAVSSTDLLLVLILADTHLKNALIVALSAVSSWTTFSVICFSVSVLAPCPAAQATTMPHLRFLNSASPLLISSVGTPSVMMKISGRQSPLTSVVVFVISLSIFCDKSSRAPPRTVQPLHRYLVA